MTVHELSPSTAVAISIYNPCMLSPANPWKSDADQQLTVQRTCIINTVKVKYKLWHLIESNSPPKADRRRSVLTFNPYRT